MSLMKNRFELFLRTFSRPSFCLLRLPFLSVPFSLSLSLNFSPFLSRLSYLICPSLFIASLSLFLILSFTAQAQSIPHPPFRLAPLLLLLLLSAPALKPRSNNTTTNSELSSRSANGQKKMTKHRNSKQRRRSGKTSPAPQQREKKKQTSLQAQPVSPLRLLHSQRSGRTRVQRSRSGPLTRPASAKCSKRKRKRRRRRRLAA